MNLVALRVFDWWSQNQLWSLSVQFCAACIWLRLLSASFSMLLCLAYPCAYQSNISPLWSLIEWWVLHIRCRETGSRIIYTLSVKHYFYWGLHSFQHDTHIRAFFHPDKDLCFLSTGSRHHGILLASRCIQSLQPSFHRLLCKLRLGLPDPCFFYQIKRLFPWNNLPSLKHFPFSYPWFSARMNQNSWNLVSKTYWYIKTWQAAKMHRRRALCLLAY